ncbi:MAG TPA: glutathione peroxidase [Clostridium sp.]
MNIYDYKFRNINGKEVSLEEYKDKAILIVNIASKCGFTPQLEDLEKLYKKYNNEGFEILGFPCNQFAEQSPESNNELNEFCKLNYGVTFKLSEKIEVNGVNAHPIFHYLVNKSPFKGFNKNNILVQMLYSILEEHSPQYLVGDSIKWNFTKFLIDKNGNSIQRFEPDVEPMDMVLDIEKAISGNM